MNCSQPEKIKITLTMFTITIRNIKTAKFLFGLSLLVNAFYSIGYVVPGDVYRYAVVGAIFELLWLPMLLCLVVIPVLSVMVIIKNKGKHRIYAALAILSTIASFIILTNH
jgi:hypothetical protein